MLRVFIGWDENEIEAYHVLSHSIIRHASAPVSITPLKLSQEPMWRDRDPKQSTEFSFSRFLVPSLCNYEGHALFMDCDMMVTRDIVELFQCANERYALQCVRHQYIPRTLTKFLGQQQSVYERKNWSAVMLFNNTRCRQLTPQYVNTASGRDLHQFKWLHDSEIGFIPGTWNFLVGEYDKPPSVPANIHWTIGGPWFPDYKDTDYADLWFAERKMIHG